MNYQHSGWPATLVQDRLTLRPFHKADAASWSQVRVMNEKWLAHWEPISGVAWRDANSPAGFRAMLRDLRRSIKAGAAWPFAICYDGNLIGGLTVGNIVRRAFCSAHVGYWIDQGHAGRGITPTALAMVCDHAFTVGGLHRIEVNIQPHNKASRRVVEKLGFREEAMYKSYLYINGEWRDHIGYGMTIEDVTDGGVLSRYLRRRSAPQDHS